jgi:hypothetical protein
MIFLVKHEHNKMFTVHIGKIGRQHTAGISRTSDLWLIVGHAPIPYQHHAINRQGLLWRVPFLKQP